MTSTAAAAAISPAVAVAAPAAAAPAAAAPATAADAGSAAELASDLESQGFRALPSAVAAGGLGLFTTVGRAAGSEVCSYEGKTSRSTKSSVNVATVTLQNRPHFLL
jgi:hypothetical protein